MGWGWRLVRMSITSLKREELGRGMVATRRWITSTGCQGFAHIAVGFFPSSFEDAVRIRKAKLFLTLPASG